MAPKRRTTSSRSAAAPSQQRTLSFQGAPTKVTKPGSSPSQKKVSEKTTALLEAHPIEETSFIPPSALPESHSPTTAETAIADQASTQAAALKSSTLDDSPTTLESVLGGRAPQELSADDAGGVAGLSESGVGDEVTAARKVSDAQIARYWRAKEAERLAPRVHQEGLGVREKVLREWDVSGEYGPCIGIARLKRWKRANALGLKPPIEVLAVLLKETDAGGQGPQRAHLDELMSSRFVET